jgi:hypothetical protein
MPSYPSWGYTRKQKFKDPMGSHIISKPGSHNITTYHKIVIERLIYSLDALALFAGNKLRTIET